MMMVVLPHGVLNSGVRLCRSSFAVPFLFSVAMATAAIGADNSWTKPNSGYWVEQVYWSLGVLPDATQSVLFTNAGWKALAIGANTAQNFPQSMSVQSLQVGSPVDSRNTLLMNWSGLERPLQTTSLIVGSNSSVVVRGSSLEVIATSTDGSTGNLRLGGTFIHADYSQVKVDGLLDVRVFGVHIQPWNAEPGRYFLTNGTLSVGGVENIGTTYEAGEFVQHGGANNVGRLGVGPSGAYELYGGEATATNGLTVGYGDFASGASFSQYGGSVIADAVINGRYLLNDGTIRGRMSVPSGIGFERYEGSILQNGGTNSAVSLVLGPSPNRFGGIGFYVLSNGVVRVDSSVRVRGGRFSQYDGLHTIVSNLLMVGTTLPGLADYTAEYVLEGGTLSASGLTAQAAVFRHNAGSNLIAGDLVLSAAPPPERGQYLLAGGFLSARNVMVGASQSGGFRQTSGSSQITEKLTVEGVTNGSFGFVLEGGTLAVKHIYVATGASFWHTNGNIVHSGFLTLNQGNWLAATGDRTLGPLQLPSNSSTISFPGGSSILRLGNSSGQAWSPSANLYITNWHGAASGGGETQLFFGSDANGLTSQQLALIKFNLSGGLYPARILATGEVVPQQQVPPPLTVSRSANNTLTLTWGPGRTLQSSTNVAGPYQDVQGATSPYTPSMGSPIQFFRLRQ